jgi:hypothetical protein
MGVQVKGLDEVKELLGNLRKNLLVPHVEIALPAKEEKKVVFLTEGTDKMVARDFLQTTPQLVLKMAIAYERAIKQNKNGFLAASNVYLETIVNRVGFSGGDVESKLAPLKESTIRSKGGNTRLFYKTGKLYKAFQRAKLKVGK